MPVNNLPPKLATSSPSAHAERGAELPIKPMQHALSSLTKRCPKCSETKGIELFSQDKNQTDGHNPRCRRCEVERIRKYALERYPASKALGATAEPGSIRAAALRRGRASAFELEVEARLKALNVDVQYTGHVFYYNDDVGKRRYWTGDFKSPSGPLIEAKGKLYKESRAAIETVLKAYPELDLRFVFQRPHGVGQVQDATITPAEWAAGLGCKWTTLDRLDVITCDLPRIRLTDEGDRITYVHTGELAGG